MDVAAWLKNLGLGQYEAAFRDNAIDGDLLPSLTAEDLKDLGVTIVGHRRKLLDAIAALGAASKPTPSPAAADPPATLPAPAVSSRPQPRSGADAERRPITVMFCDLVGSTSLAAKLDAEDWRTLVNAYLDEASAAVTGLGGHVLKKLGDGLMALFGYPQAQENDAERAVRAALAIQRALADLNARNTAIRRARAFRSHRHRVRLCRGRRRRRGVRRSAERRRAGAQLGVNMGDRKRLLRAIASLGVAEPAPRPPTPAPASSAMDTAERRPITIMFCDLVGSMNLAAKMDAEDWRNLVGAYLDEASGAVAGLGGHVLKRLGDGLMALFGYPHAQENDAERAVRAALAILRALVEINTRNASKGAPELSARIGLDSGSVVVDAAGEVFGEAPNVAARVQAAAEPGTVLITASVQRQTAGLFVVEDKGAHDLKGVTAPVALYRVVRASGGGRRGGARALTPLVGREDELTLLTRRWSRALEGDGQFVQIVGEPGIGKSRLIEEFRAKLAETPHTWVEWAASQLLQNTPLHPLAEWGRLRFGGADATDEGQLADLENTLRLVGLDPDEYAPLIAPLVDIPLPEERSAKLAPEELRRRQLAAVTAWYFAGARAQTAVLVFEDLHWADPTSLDLMRSLAERGAQAPLLIVATTRPEFRPPWAMRSHHGVISLAPLDRAEVRRMVGEIASQHALSDEMIDGVGERSGGVPLFVEEVTRLLLERDTQGGAQAIPPTLQQSLAARLDRLGEAREVAQIGAVLGRDFSYRLLSDVSSSAAGFDELRLQAALDRLMEADLLFVDGAPPAAAYRFKHALIQDAAYDSLLKSRRQVLHRRAAEALCDANAEPEAIAHHFTQAGLDDLAIEWWGKAGDQALRRSAFQEAIAHLGKAIGMADRAGATVRRGPDGAAAPNQRLTQFNVSYGTALIAARGYGAPETTEAFARARELALWRQGCARTIGGRLGLMGRQRHERRLAIDAGARSGLPQRHRGETRFARGRRRPSLRRDHLLVRRRVSRGAGSPRKGARPVPTRPQ